MPPSRLTRSVFRRLLANEPLVHRGCLRRQPHRSLSQPARFPRTLVRCNAVSAVCCSQRRSFFNFNIFAKREDRREADMEPGIDKMMELAKKQRMRARLPPPEEVAEAFRQLFHAKRKTEKHAAPITDTEAQLALQSLRYLMTCELEARERGEQPSRIIGEGVILTASKIVGRKPAYLSTAHVDLARLLYELSEEQGGSNASFVAYVRTMSATGSAEKAREFVLAYEDSIAKEPNPAILQDGKQRLARDSTGKGDMDVPDALAQAWTSILRGFISEDDEVEVQRTLTMMEERSLKKLSGIPQLMLDFNLRRADLAGVKRWWATYHDNRVSVYAVYLRKVLVFCLERGEMEFGHEIVKDVMSSNPPKHYWDAIFIWAAGTKKSVDEIDRMMSVMEKSNADVPDASQWRVPDIETINGLVELAISRNDPYMAERFIALGRDRNIEPDAKTYVLQMDYRLSVDDVDGALVAYKNLQSHDVSSNEDVPTVNRLIAALAKTNRHDFDTIMNVAADLSDRRVRFEPQTVSTLGIVHLNRDEYDDVLDLLNTHAFHYSSAERESIRDTIFNYTLDPQTPTSRAWQGYNLLKAVFDETARPERTDLMTSFLNRERADMGVRVFQNMRQHHRADTIPTIDTYVAAFMGLAKLRDLESLEVIHNLLKLDYNINVNTYLLNTLIIAYTACGEAREALTFWEDIVASREGPSYSSIHAALRACEKSAFGDLRAKKIWSLLQHRGVELDQSLWASYISALAGNGNVELAIKTMEQAAENEEMEIDYFVLGSLHGAATGQAKHAEVEVFAKDKYPEAWQRLETFGYNEDENGMKTFRIDRKVGP